MNYTKNLAQIANELGLNFNEDAIQCMLSLLENGISPDNMVKILEEIKLELINMQNDGQKRS